ncbi:MAG: TetR/AcrR family transcriptional regulator [Spirochaetales bacterium]|nr:TetR/AcrR family transcriptional regulator [Spirochaetales bacterium]
MQNKIIGREAVMRAVIDAACDLFSEKSPSRVSIREIAEKAGVNHGLIHRHFGSKRNLIQAVLTDIDKQIRDASGSGKSFEEIFRLASRAALNDSRIWRIPARLIMDGDADLLQENQTSFLRELKDMAAKDFIKGGFQGLSSDDSIYLLIALGLGMEMFGDYISRSMKIEAPSMSTILPFISTIISEQ